ncbi:MAG: hypothetical protein H6555_12450 [Lewinellaceae bacterium]|nr:hypothetical protein [Lewinellaceae bacterium]
MMMRKKLNLITLIMTITGLTVLAQPRQADVVVDAQGVMRWGGTQEEVYGFGVNYTAPFAHAYRQAQGMGINLEQAIRDDVYHFARLGFDLYRVHVWDTEISDTLGNLLENEHLRLFDFLVKEVKSRGMNLVITPIAFWGNGWPEPDEPTPGFSAKYGKDGCLTQEGAIKAQENYLAQFLNHVNPYTGLAYKEDPAVLAFEVSNEPHHQQEAPAVTAFIKRMVGAMRSTGCKKPIFYNVSHRVHLAEAYFASGIQGGTFQWYPTGLGSRHELGGNLLPNVDRYAIPFDSVIRKAGGAKIVYEFDAADVGRSYIYPVMARSFRTAGIQVATHFAYDPTFLGPFNTEYNTHYMNLVYAPQKALSLKIAAAVFHQVPRYQSYGAYPANLSFGDFRVSYEQDLAELVNSEQFFYTNHTTTRPPAPERLQEVAGWGLSPVVDYPGSGAYFLDRLAPGVWRLEVMPDAVWTQDPFGWNSPHQRLAETQWRTWPMQIRLPDLGERFSIKGLQPGNTYRGQADRGIVTVQPGTYLLVKAGTSTQLTGESLWKNIRLDEFSAPPSAVDKIMVRHEPSVSVLAGQEITISAQVVSPGVPRSVVLQVNAGWRPARIVMQPSGANQYTARIPKEMVREGLLTYHLVVETAKGVHTWPENRPGGTRDWDFGRPQPYEVVVLPTGSPVYLFAANRDRGWVDGTWLPGLRWVPTAVPGQWEYQVWVDKLFRPDEENLNGERIDDYSFRHFFGTQVAGFREELGFKKKLILRGRSLTDGPSTIQVAVILQDGSAFGALVTVPPQSGDCAVPLADFKRVPVVTLPRPYPTFLPYFFADGNAKTLDLRQAESLQISLGPGLPAAALEMPQGVAIESVRVE